MVICIFADSFYCIECVAVDGMLTEITYEENT